MSTNKTYTTAVVLIPPEAVWKPIQEIRRIHDRNFRRWMPHITLLYPFAERVDFPNISPNLIDAAEQVKSFTLNLSQFDFFRHRRNCTIFLRPEPEDAVVNLHTNLVKALPEYDDTAKFPGGFHPHLSVGQFQHGKVRQDQQRLQSGWTPIRFEATEISLIYRAPETQDRFVVAETFALKGS
jgi:RNA 2',3'-cyclic 3'-phosphodiesterase